MVARATRRATRRATVKTRTAATSPTTVTTVMTRMTVTIHVITASRALAATTKSVSASRHERA